MPTPQKVLLLGRRDDAELVRQCWQKAYEYVVCEPTTRATDFADDAHFEFVVSSGLLEHESIETALAARFPLIVLLEADDSSAAERVRAGAFVVFRGPTAFLQLLQGARHCAESLLRRSFISAVEGPLVHDLHGIVGIVYLSARLLEAAKQDGGPITSHANRWTLVAVSAGG